MNMKWNNMNSSHHSIIALTINNKFLEFDVEYEIDPEQGGDFYQEHIPERFEILRLSRVNCDETCNSLIDDFKSDIIEQIKESFLEY